MDARETADHSTESAERVEARRVEVQRTGLARAAFDVRRQHTLRSVSTDTSTGERRGLGC